MTTITSLMGSFGGALSTFLAFLFVLTVVVFIHELGHFLVARWCGVTVTTFSIGFGKEIWGFYDKHGTRWRLAWIPLGGYVKFLDDENGASVPDRAALDKMTPEQRAGSFHQKPVGHRAAVVAAGPIANFLLAIAIFAGIYSIVGIQSTEARVDEVVAGSPAEAAGFMPGDVFLDIDGTHIESFNDVLRIVGTSPNRPLDVGVDRGGVKMRLKVTPQLKEETDNLGGKHARGIIGVKRTTTPQTMVVRKAGPLEAVWLGVKETWFITSMTGQYLRDVITRRQSADQLGGPIRIAEVSGQVAKISFAALLNLIAVISVSVGLLNLLPIPLLDGGHLLFYAIEAVLRRPLSDQVQEMGFRIGLAVLLMVMVFATFNDLPILRKWFS